MDLGCPRRKPTAWVNAMLHLSKCVTIALQTNGVQKYVFFLGAIGPSLLQRTISHPCDSLQLPNESDRELLLPLLLPRSGLAQMGSIGYGCTDVTRSTAAACGQRFTLLRGLRHYGCQCRSAPQPQVLRCAPVPPYIHERLRQSEVSSHCVSTILGEEHRGTCVDGDEELMCTGLLTHCHQLLQSCMEIAAHEIVCRCIAMYVLKFASEDPLDSPTGFFVRPVLRASLACLLLHLLVLLAFSHVASLFSPSHDRWTPERDSLSCRHRLSQVTVPCITLENRGI